MESLVEINKFEILDMPGMSTLAFVVEEDFKAYKDGNAFLSLQKIECSEVEEDGKIKKIFSVLAGEKEKQLIVLLTLTQNKAILSVGELTKEGFSTVQKNVPLSYGTIYNKEGVEYKEIEYTPDLKRQFSIIDTQTGEEVKPTLYVDKSTNTIKGKCKILPNRPYIVLELNFKEDNNSN